MLFNSIPFALFFPTVVVIYFLLNHKYRWLFLLVASYYFYMNWKPVYAILIMASTITTWYCGILLEKASTKFVKRVFLTISLVINFGILITFKYFNFLNDAVFQLMESLNFKWDVPNLDLLLPVGISFYTFQAVGYTIDVYRGKHKAEKHFGIYALFVSFFPQLVAGPIERVTNLLPQFRDKHTFNYSRAVYGLKLMLWGYFMKLVVVEWLAIHVDAVYNNSNYHSGITLAVATIFFAFQIYCDFAGYSIIAIGAAKIMGFDLMTNFNRPYFSKSISEFWKRWHISLSTWFKDYLYIPLGGNRVSVPRWYFNLIFVFTVSGLWHGANWTFLVWGALNGFYLVFAIVSLPFREKLNSIFKVNRFPKADAFFQISITFLLTCLAWVFFRAESLNVAIEIIKKIFTFSGKLFIGSPSFFIFGIVGITILLTVDIFQEFFNAKWNYFVRSNILLKTISIIAIIVLILMIGVLDGGQFIYFQF